MYKLVQIYISCCNFLYKQGQGFKVWAAPPYPNLGQVPLPPWGTEYCFDPQNDNLMCLQSEIKPLSFPCFASHFYIKCNWSYLHSSLVAPKGAVLCWTIIPALTRTRSPKYPHSHLASHLYTTDLRNLKRW